MRITSLVALAVLACGTAFSATRSEMITYVDGNITGIAPHTGGTLQFSDEAALTVRTGGKTIKVPYASINKAQLGGTLSHSHDVPLYKVWALPKRVFPKTATQYLTVDFKNDAGESRTMTLEVAEVSASKVLSTIDSRRSTVDASAPAPATDSSTPTSTASSATADAAPAADAAASTPADAPASTPAEAPAVAAKAPEAAPSTPETLKVAATSKKAKAAKVAAAPKETKASRAATTNAADADFWSNQVWKTSRNADKWPQSSSVAAGGQE